MRRRSPAEDVIEGNIKSSTNDSQPEKINSLKPEGM